MSVSFLSQVERGVSSITLTSLHKIADALEVNMNELVDVEEGNQYKYISNANSQIITRLGKNYRSFVRLSGKFQARKLEGFLLIMEPHLDDSEESSHEGEEFYYVTKGEAVFILDDEEFRVGQGESIHYPSSVRHRIANRNDTELVMICIITPAIF